MCCSQCKQKIDYAKDIICCRRDSVGRTYVYHADCNRPTGYKIIKTSQEKGVNPFFGNKMGVYSL